jgi:hypothetical protein
MDDFFLGFLLGIVFLSMLALAFGGKEEISKGKSVIEAHIYVHECKCETEDK